MGIVAMFLKTLRIYVIVKSGLRRRKITGRGILTISAVCYICWILYLTFYYNLYPPRVVARYSTAITGQLTTSYYCSRGNDAVEVALLAVECLVLLASAALCYFTRDIPDAINEARVIAFGKIDTVISLLFHSF